MIFWIKWNCFIEGFPLKIIDQQRKHSTVSQSKSIGFIFRKLNYKTYFRWNGGGILWNAIKTQEVTCSLVLFHDQTLLSKSTNSRRKDPILQRDFSYTHLIIVDIVCIASNLGYYFGALPNILFLIDEEDVGAKLRSWGELSCFISLLVTRWLKEVLKNFTNTTLRVE